MPRRKIAYVAALEFVSGEYSVNFTHEFSVEDGRSPERHVHGYLKDFYGKECLDEADLGGGRYLYNGGCVAIRVRGIARVAPTAREAAMAKALVDLHDGCGVHVRAGALRDAREVLAAAG